MKQPLDDGILNTLLATEVHETMRVHRVAGV